MTKKLSIAVNKWENSIIMALVYGKGRHKQFVVEDLYDYMKLIFWIRQEKLSKAHNYSLYYMDTYIRDQIPSIIRYYLFGLH